jgi:hypothetical protein
MTERRGRRGEVPTQLFQQVGADDGRHAHSISFAPAPASAMFVPTTLVLASEVRYRRR